MPVPQVQPVINDASAYFEQNHSEKFEVVCFGLLDSHAMFSAITLKKAEGFSKIQGDETLPNGI